MKNNEFKAYLTCIGVVYNREVYVPKHRTVDGSVHYSAGICVPCVELTRKLRISKTLSSNGLEKELEKVWEHKGLNPLMETPKEKGKNLGCYIISKKEKKHENLKH